MSTKQQTLKGPISFSGKGLHTGVEVTMTGNPAVADNGSGINEKKLPMLFSGYFIHAEEQSGDVKRNMGIGLSVCLTIIKAHGGTMTAGNLPEGGAEFTFTLPLERAL